MLWRQEERKCKQQKSKLEDFIRKSFLVCTDGYRLMIHDTERFQRRNFTLRQREEDFTACSTRDMSIIVN